MAGNFLVLTTRPDNAIEEMRDDCGPSCIALLSWRATKFLRSPDFSGEPNPMTRGMVQAIVVTSDCSNGFTCDKCKASLCVGCGQEVIHNYDTDKTICVECCGRSIWACLNDGCQQEWIATGGHVLDK